MQPSTITFLLPFVAIFSSCHAKINASEPLAVAITPKIWNLLTTKANFISSVVTSIKFPDFDGKVCFDNKYIRMYCMLWII
ncbi:hypothetical protein ANCCAN_29718 [Ancylostoma caninum]|uniref:Uncharacterized protein n=1 Tax=Ancylostoma caninum TaxID=29170 RepID=A0A368EXS6_ANCCA|nr:hypothetical protein ANCCAN_29718 [Ancylostoma caninum]